MPRLELPDGAHLNYEIAGDGPTVTLIHPGLWDLRTWDREFASFADAGYRDFATTSVGTEVRAGPSRASPYLARSEISKRSSLPREVTQTAIVGCSMGGGIDVDYALEHPERVWGLVLVATGLGGFESTEEEEDWWAERDAPIEAALFEAGDLERAQDLLSRSGRRRYGRRTGPRSADRPRQHPRADDGRERLGAARSSGGPSVGGGSMCPR